VQDAQALVVHAHDLDGAAYGVCPFFLRTTTTDISLPVRKDVLPVDVLEHAGKAQREKSE